MYTEVLPQSTANLLNRLSQNPQPAEKFYLTGGTALSLHLGHRESEDLDFFSKESFDPKVLQKKLIDFGILEDVELDKGTLNCFLNGVKLQFLHYPYKLLKKPAKWKRISVSSLIDITCTKLITVSERGDKKDFIDLYVLFKHYSLPYLFKQLKQKYEKVDYSQTAILKSLVYFEDAEKQPMPRMHIELTWEEVKNEIREKVKKFKF
ncbi:nucleotidyl transferase AbiEii/AbiGii toxin family protein [Patescibacteria group bacterium]|nr:nucleotidyl transferase AbiEii/AbiGii toxin family protein [Patescibacteria group bacterium]